MCVCSQSVCSADTAKNRRYHKLLGRHSNLLPREKDTTRLSRSGKGIWCGVSFWHQEAHLFRNAWIVFPVSAILVDCYFCIYLFYFMSLFFVIGFLLFLIQSPWYLLNTPPNRQVWYKAFLKWVWVQDCCADMSAFTKMPRAPLVFP